MTKKTKIILIALKGIEKSISVKFSFEILFHKTKTNFIKMEK